MIKVEPRPEPDSFDAQVRKPGQKALDEGRDPLPTHWRRCLAQLWTAYDGICAYSCFFIPRVVGASTVEHFAPKSGKRELAYEWSNYRLVCALLNSRKRDFADVLDPFEIEDGWFELEFLFMQVRPAESLTDVIRKQVEETIQRLKLNDQECTAERARWYEDWRKGEITAAYMERHAPFIYREAVRQRVAP